MTQKERERTGRAICVFLKAQAQAETDGRQGACVGCGFEKGCADKGCAVLRKISQIAAESGAGAKKGENRQ